MWTLKWTLKTLPNYLNPGIHTVFPLACGDGFLFWHVAVRRKCVPMTWVLGLAVWWLLQVHPKVLSQMYVIMPVLQLWYSVCPWCLNVPPSETAVLIKSVRNGDHSAKYLSAFWETFRISIQPQILPVPSSNWIGMDLWQHDDDNTSLLTREALQIEIIKHSYRVRPNLQQQRKRKSKALTSFEKEV